MKFIFIVFLLVTVINGVNDVWAVGSHGCQFGTDCVASSDLVSHVVAPGDPITCIVRLQHADNGTPTPSDTVTPISAHIVVHHADGNEDSGELVSPPSNPLNDSEFKDFFFETIARVADANSTLFATGFASGHISSANAPCSGSFGMSINVAAPSLQCTSTVGVLTARCSSCVDAIVLGTLTRVCRICSAPLP